LGAERHAKTSQNDGAAAPSTAVPVATAADWKHVSEVNGTAACYYAGSLGVKIATAGVRPTSCA